MEQMCYKCHTEKANYKIRLQLICKSCFISITEHTFRCTLKTSIFPKRGEKLLICVSGGANSTSMLHLTDTCNNPLKTKKMMGFIAGILYIDDSIIYNTPPEATEIFLNDLNSRYSYPIYTRRLQDLVPDILERLPESPQSQSDMLYLLIHSSIVATAKELGFTKVITAESASRISSLVLSGICKGSGASVNRFANPCIIEDGISIGRPMRELLDKEVCIYQHLITVPVLPKLSISMSKGMTNTSIDILVQDFLQNLQSKFPSTVHTLLRTASKLVPVDIQDKCQICNGPKDSPACPLERFRIEDENICYSCHHFKN